MATTKLDEIKGTGCVVRGETDHDRHIASAVAQGLTTVAIETGVPVALGVITCGDLDQAHARAGGAKGNKGVEAMGGKVTSFYLTMGDYDYVSIAEFPIPSTTTSLPVVWQL